ncbi:unnamed protein product [Amoebophrya sp. A25]|nr:unnamed protein product [Amoebophrya sp. A25]|eukprot:GSA25T00027052001.1
MDEPCWDKYFARFLELYEEHHVGKKIPRRVLHELEGLYDSKEVVELRVVVRATQTRDVLHMWNRMHFKASGFPLLQTALLAMRMEREYEPEILQRALEWGRRAPDALQMFKMVASGPFFEYGHDPGARHFLQGLQVVFGPSPKRFRGAPQWLIDEWNACPEDQQWHEVLTYEEFLRELVYLMSEKDLQIPRKRAAGYLFLDPAIADEKSLKDFSLQTPVLLLLLGYIKSEPLIHDVCERLDEILERNPEEEDAKEDETNA